MITIVAKCDDRGCYGGASPPEMPPCGKRKGSQLITKPRTVKALRANNLAAATSNGGGPLMIAMELIDEDPNQPRSNSNPGFSSQSIGELAASFGPKGPKSPISLRDSEKPGRYTINHGHRRYRASKMKGLTVIPSFIDNDYNEVDQVIENLQRNELTPREIAEWIGRELAKGMKKSDVARSIGKSAAFVSQHATLLNLPPPVASVFNSGRVSDVTVVNELVTAYKKYPSEVTAWLDDSQQEVTRGGVKLLRNFLEQKRTEAQYPSDEEDVNLPDSGELNNSAQLTGVAADTEPPEAGKFGRSIILVEHHGRPARLNLRRRPSAVGLAWLRYEDDGQEQESSLADVKLVALIEGST